MSAADRSGGVMDAEAVRDAYSRWVKVYDWVFGPLFTRARRRAIGLLDPGPGDRILEVGVGTGLSLPLFATRCTVVGVDFSRPMLQRASRRLHRPIRAHCLLVEGDGARLPFADATFDGVLAPYVVSAAPEPEPLLRDVVRVCRPGARIVVLNHFSAAGPWLAAAERQLEPVTSRLLGFHAHFPMRSLFEAVELEIEHVERVPPLRYWQIVCCTAAAPAASG